MFGSLKSINNVVNSGQRVFVAYCVGIDPAVIKDRAKGSVVFWDEEHWSGVRRIRGLNESSVQVVVDKFSGRVSMSSRHADELGWGYGGCVGFEVDLVVKSFSSERG